jgi:hypothetical protein
MSKNNNIVTVVAASDMSKARNPERRMAALAVLIDELSAIEPAGEIIVSTDHEMKTHYTGLKKAWLTADRRAQETRAEGVLVFEEDALVSPYIYSLLPHLLQSVDRVARENDFRWCALQLGAMGGVAPEVLEQNSFLSRNWLSWHWGVYMPATRLAALVDFDAAMVGKFSYSSWDDVLTHYAQANELRILTPLPNLVSHRLPRATAKTHQNTGNIGGRERISTVYSPAENVLFEKGVRRENKKWTPNPAR